MNPDQSPPKKPGPLPGPRAFRPMEVELDGVRYRVDPDGRVYAASIVRVPLPEGPKNDGRGRKITHTTRSGPRRRVKDRALIERVLREGRRVA